MPEIPSDVRRRLEEHPWEETTARLLRHADNKIRRLLWRGSRDGHPPGGIQPGDIVQTVYEKVLSGTRNWNPDKHPDLFEYLRDQVDSEISNLVCSAENRRFRPEAALPVGKLERGDVPEVPVLADENERQSEEFLLGFLDVLKHEPDLQKVVEAIVDGVGKPGDIAQHLGVRVEEIYSRRKKLIRRLEDYRAGRAAAITPSKGGTSRA
jgi:DNA-directed RNA polymerase specialized sigma24 family protein